MGFFIIKTDRNWSLQIWRILRRRRKDFLGFSSSNWQKLVISTTNNNNVPKGRRFYIFSSLKQTGIGHFNWKLWRIILRWRHIDFWAFHPRTDRNMLFQPWTIILRQRLEGLGVFHFSIFEMDTNWSSKLWTIKLHIMAPLHWETLEHFVP